MYKNLSLQLIIKSVFGGAHELSQYLGGKGGRTKIQGQPELRSKFKISLG